MLSNKELVNDLRDYNKEYVVQTSDALLVDDPENDSIIGMAANRIEQLEREKSLLLEALGKCSAPKEHRKYCENLIASLSSKKDGQ